MTNIPNVQQGQRITASGMNELIGAVNELSNGQSSQYQNGNTLNPSETIWVSNVLRQYPFAAVPSQAMYLSDGLGHTPEAAYDLWLRNGFCFAAAGGGLVNAPGQLPLVQKPVKNGYNGNNATQFTAPNLFAGWVYRSKYEAFGDSPYVTFGYDNMSFLGSPSDTRMNFFQQVPAGYCANGKSAISAYIVARSEWAMDEDFEYAAGGQNWSGHGQYCFAYLTPFFSDAPLFGKIVGHSSQTHGLYNVKIVESVLQASHEPALLSNAIYDAFNVAELGDNEYQKLDGEVVRLYPTMGSTGFLFSHSLTKYTEPSSSSSGSGSGVVEIETETKTVVTNVECVDGEIVVTTETIRVVKDSSSSSSGSGV